MQILCIRHRGDLPSPRAPTRAEDAGGQPDEVMLDNVFDILDGPAVELKVIGRLRPTARMGLIEMESSITHWDFHINIRDMDKKELYYIPWVEAPERQAPNGNCIPAKLICIMFELVDACSARFCRIGTFSVDQKEIRMQILEPQGGEGQIRGWEYDSVTGNHTIYIV